jgi:hypothetical protein
MPTGYTAAVGDGKITEFPEFVWSCARAFGALIMMRDDPMDAPIPQAFTPDTRYEDERIASATAALAELPGLSYGECVARANAEYQEAAQAHAKRATERVSVKQRYETMLAKVEAWQAPSPDHAELRSFMVQQLSESIRFDCSGTYDTAPTRLTGEQWREQAIQKAGRALQYGTENRDKEIARTAGRNEWLRTLRVSLAQGMEAGTGETALAGSTPQARQPDPEGDAPPSSSSPVVRGAVTR